MNRGTSMALAGLLASAVIAGCSEDTKAPAGKDAGKDTGSGTAGGGGTAGTAGTAGTSGTAGGAGTGGSAGADASSAGADAGTDATAGSAGADAGTDAATCPDAAITTCDFLLPAGDAGVDGFFDDATSTFHARLASSAPGIASAKLYLSFCDCESYGCMFKDSTETSVDLTVGAADLSADVSGLFSTFTDALVTSLRVVVTTTCGDVVTAYLMNEDDFVVPSTCTNQFTEVRWCTTPAMPMPPTITDGGTGGGTCMADAGTQTCAPAKDLTTFADEPTYDFSSGVLTVPLLAGTSKLNDATATIFTCQCVGDGGTGCVAGTGQVQRFALDRNADTLSLDLSTKVNPADVMDLVVTLDSDCGETAEFTVDSPGFRCAGRFAGGSPDCYEP